MRISKKSLSLIIESEVTSEKHYTAKLSGIVVPGADSGATVGIGYDCGHNSASDIQKHWIKYIGQQQVDILKMFAGLKGQAAKKAVANNPLAKSVKIPFSAALSVFYDVSAPIYLKRAKSIYDLDKLPPDAVGAILSIVYNRGASLDGPRRKEMKDMVQQIKDADLKAIAASIRSMKRLWVGTGNDGLIVRREKEAVLVERANRQYSDDELVDI